MKPAQTLMAQPSVSDSNLPSWCQGKTPSWEENLTGMAGQQGSDTGRIYRKTKYHQTLLWMSTTK
jgi:hypothetical protein